MQHFKRYGAFPTTLSSMGDALGNEDTENTLSFQYKGIDQRN